MGFPYHSLLSASFWGSSVIQPFCLFLVCVPGVLFGLFRIVSQEYLLHGRLASPAIPRSQMASSLRPGLQGSLVRAGLAEVAVTSLLSLDFFLVLVETGLMTSPAPL